MDKFSDIFECIERRFVLLSREFMSDLVINVEKMKQMRKRGYQPWTEWGV